MDCSMPGFTVFYCIPNYISNSCSFCRWCHWTISSSVAPFSSCLLSFQALESFPMTWLFASGGQSIGASPLASVLLVNIQSWFPIGFTGLSPHSPRDSQKSSQAPQFKKASILQHPAYFMVQCSHLYMTTGKKYSFDYIDLIVYSWIIIKVTWVEKIW